MQPSQLGALDGTWYGAAFVSRPAGIPFGSYVLSRRLARGGMAEVFLAHQRGPEGFARQVALKRILPHLLDSADFVRMFLDEARLAARLSHPNVVHIYELGKVAEHYFIAMEFVDGVHAGRLLQWAEHTPLPPTLVARIGAYACAGLHYAHELRDGNDRPLKLVHRDVSPPNLMISYDGGVKLVDFGIAKAVSHVEQTRPGVVKGKFAYMSPEQTVGRKLNGRSDVYSLALVLWELLAGRAAVRRDDPVEGMRQIRDGKIARIEDVRRDIPPALAAALGMALSSDPAERASAAELGTALEAFLKVSPDLTTSMELAAWLREHVPRAPTGSHREVAAPTGTRPATMAATQATASTGAVSDALQPASMPQRAATAPTVPHRVDADSHTRMDLAAMPLSAPESATDLGPLHTTAIVPRLEPQRARTATGTSRAPSVGPRAQSSRRRIAAAALLTVLGFAGVTLLFGRPPVPKQRVVGPPALEMEPPEELTVPAEVPLVALTPDAAPVPKPARLELVTDPPGASIRVGDEPPRASPATFADLAAGAHVVRVELDGYRAIKREVQLTAGERRTLELALAPIPPPKPRPRKRPAPVVRRPAPPATGRITVRTTPYSVVYLGARKLGVTPFANVELPAGNHTLTFRNPTRPSPHQRQVTVRPGKATKLNFALP